MSTLTLTVNNSSPTGAGSVTSPAGGTWAAKANLSIRIVAWYTESETDVDNAGIRRTTVAAWEGLSVSANDYLSFAFTHADPAPHHYSFYYQAASSWDSANTATKCTATITPASLTQSTVVVLDDDDTATITFGAAANAVTIDPISDLPPTTRQNTRRAFNDKLIPVDHIAVRLLDSFDIVFPVTASSVTQAEYMRLMRWIKNSVRLSAAWDQTGGDTFLDSSVGKLTASSYLQAAGMTSAYEASLRFEVESETEEN